MEETFYGCFSIDLLPTAPPKWVLEIFEGDLKTVYTLLKTTFYSQFLKLVVIVSITNLSVFALLFIFSFTHE